MNYQCFKCGAEYRNHQTLMRHVRNHRPKTVLKCNRCPHVLSVSLRYRMHRHQTAVHGLKKMDITEVTIPTLMGSQRSKQKTDLVSEIVKNPKESQSVPSNEISPVRSPTNITLGFDSHPSVTPVKKDLLELFGSPKKLLSPLPPTPKKRKLNASTEKKDSIHLTLPDTKAVEEGKKWQRFLAPPSLFSKDKVAETIRSVRKEAVRSPTYVGSVLPYRYGCVRKQEKVVFPDGTVYSLTASWVADPTLAMLQEAGVQTSPEKVEVREKVEVSDKEVNTPPFYNAWSIGEKCVDTSDLFSSQSPIKDTKPNICVLEPVEETIIDLTMSDEEDSGSDTSFETDTAAESDESHVKTVRVVIECEDSDI